MHTQQARQKWIDVLLLFPFALLVWAPLWFMLTGSLMPQDELAVTVGPALGMGTGYACFHLFPTWPTLSPILTLVLDTPQFFAMFWNSVVQSFAQVIGWLLVGTPAAWAISRFHFRGRNAVRILYIILMLMPFQVTMVPNYLVLQRLNLLDTVWAIVLPGIFSTFPVFIMQRGFDAVSQEILESADIDGANSFQSFVFIGIPLGLPGIMAALTLNFLEAWNAIEQPMTFLKDQTLWPLSLYLTNVTTENLGMAMVASLIMLMPSALIFRFGQKYLELGIQSGAVKG